MDEQLKTELLFYETDVDGAVDRFSGDENLYVHCLVAFLDDATMDELEKAINAQKWDEAFTAAHAFKGVVGNMGFIPLYHATAKIVVLLRAGKITELQIALKDVKRLHARITEAIRLYFNLGGLK